MMAMRIVSTIASVTVAAVLGLSGCAAHRVRPPAVPAALRPPNDQIAFLEVHATGVQIYECASKPDASGAFAWIFQAPEAALIGRRGHTIGRHYAGPTWELRDGSRVAGEVVARDPGPDPTAIPWLLLKAKSASTSGRLSLTQSILRIHTVGGVAPSAPCTEALAHTLVRVPYTAKYYFYKAAS
jgi:FtsP/CotA-like multicopper oxidase with cupredoxin domain